MSGEDELTIAGVCAYLKISRATLHRWTRDELLHPVKVPGVGVRYSWADVRALVDRSTDGAGAGRRDDVIEAALALLSEQRAEDERPLCPGCGRRSSRRGATFCGSCEDDRAAVAAPIGSAPAP